MKSQLFVPQNDEATVLVASCFFALLFVIPWAITSSYNRGLNLHLLQISTLPMKYEWRPHVLLVEDNDYFAQVLVDIFEAMGCDVTAVRDARSALVKLTETQPHAVFCDIQLPGDMDGVEFAINVRSKPEFSTTQLIAISGHATEDMTYRTRAAGFDRLLSKPVKFADLSKLIFGDTTVSQKV